MYAIISRHSIELDFQMYLADGHFLFIHFLNISQQLPRRSIDSDFTHILNKTNKMTGRTLPQK
jgi:hypothetical protein